MEITKISTIILISLFAAISPGPDFAIVTRNCLLGTFRAGLLTALGVASALLIHVIYCLLGIGVLVQESPIFFHALKYCGAIYLFYLGIQLLKEEISPKENSEIEMPIESKKKNKPFLSGFLCNLLNPKATLFVLSLFTQFIDPTMNFSAKALLGSIFAIVVFIWFALLSYLITHRLLQKHFARFQLIITKAMGVSLCFLAIFVAFF